MGIRFYKLKKNDVFLRFFYLDSGLAGYFGEGEQVTGIRRRVISDRQSMRGCTKDRNLKSVAIEACLTNGRKGFIRGRLALE